MRSQDQDPPAGGRPTGSSDEFTGRSSSRRLATKGSWPRPVRSHGTWATTTSGSSISSSPLCRTQTLCPPKSSAGSSLRGRLVLPSATSSLWKGGAAVEATHRRPAAVPSEPCQRGRCSPRTSLPVTRSADVRRQLRAGPYWVRTASGICGSGRAQAVTTGTTESQVAAPSRS
jgi:hypothetical protein